jgi:ADP-ribose pyrophosphatase YjhB (NUDIX family)
MNLHAAAASDRIAGDTEGLPSDTATREKHEEVNCHPSHREQKGVESNDGQRTAWVFAKIRLLLVSVMHTILCQVSPGAGTSWQLIGALWLVNNGPLVVDLSTDIPKQVLIHTLLGEAGMVRRTAEAVRAARPDRRR